MMSKACWAMALLGLVGIGSARGEPTTPNVVLILADDLGWGDVGFNGRSEWATPRLDALAREGVRFPRFYTAGVVCAPSRAALLSGKSTIHCGVTRNDADLPAGETTLAEALHAKGYRTALFGKWHRGKPRPGAASWTHPMDQGFDEFFGFTLARHGWEKFPAELEGGRERVPVQGYADDLFAAKAAEFVRANKERPFFLYLSLISAHFLIEAPEDEIAKHAKTFRDRRLATYAAMVTRMDRHVGEVVDAIDGAGLGGRTLIVFTSDHGATFERGNQGTSAALASNGPLRGQKRTLWEGGVRVPALARWTGRLPAGTEQVGPFQAIDLFPTLLAAVGGMPDPAWKLDGRDMLGVWQGTATAPERDLFWEWRTEGHQQLATMRGDWKLVITREGKPELFEVASDPGELHDRSAERPAEVERMQAALRAWLATEIAE